MSEDQQVDAMQQQQQAVVGHGMEQFRLLHKLLPDGMPAGGWAAAEAAAAGAARFAAVEEWAQGPMWLAVGPKLLLFSWAWEHGLDLDDYRRYRAEAAAEDANGSTPVTGAAATA
jgi:hypothetical protein